MRVSHWLKYGKFIFHNSGSQKSNIKMSADVISCEDFVISLSGIFLLSIYRSVSIQVHIFFFSSVPKIFK